MSTFFNIFSHLNEDGEGEEGAVDLNETIQDVLRLRL